MLVRSYYAKVEVEEDYFLSFYIFLEKEKYESWGLDLGGWFFYRLLYYYLII